MYYIYIIIREKIFNKKYNLINQILQNNRWMIQNFNKFYKNFNLKKKLLKVININIR